MTMKVTESGYVPTSSHERAAGSQREELMRCWDVVPTAANGGNDDTFGEMGRTD
jgi:hypothetical protein